MRNRSSYHVQVTLRGGRTYDALQMRCNVQAQCSCSPQVPHLMQQTLQDWQSSRVADCHEVATLLQRPVKFTNDRSPARLLWQSGQGGEEARGAAESFTAKLGKYVIQAGSESDSEDVHVPTTAGYRQRASSL